jgi:hypothetical protein
VSIGISGSAIGNAQVPDACRRRLAARPAEAYGISAPPAGSRGSGVRFDAQDARATTRPPARPTASAIAERAAGLIVQLMPAQLSIPSQEPIEDLVQVVSLGLVKAIDRLGNLGGDRDDPLQCQVRAELC